MDYTSFAPGASASQPIPPKLEPAPQRKHFFNKKFATTFAVLLSLGAVTYGGFWWWQQMEIARNDEALLDVPVVTTSPQTNDTSNWATYTNTKYGFEVKYPTQDYLLNGSDGIDYENTFLQKKSGPEQTIYFSVQIQNQSFDKAREGLNKVVAGQNLIESPVVFAGENGYAYVEKYPDPNLNGNSGLSPYTILIKHNNTVYEIFTQKYNLDEIKQVFSTFKFTTSANAGQFCGGIAGVTCPSGYSCKYEGDYPDAGGTCVKN